MTGKEVFIQLILEVKGCSEEVAEDFLVSITPILPEGHSLSDELSEKDANNLISNLRKDKEGFKQLLEIGAKLVEQKSGHA